MKKPEPSPTSADDRCGAPCIAPVPPPKRLRNCCISGGRLSIWHAVVARDEALAILTLTETTAGLTRSISVANDGAPCCIEIGRHDGRRMGGVRACQRARRTRPRRRAQRPQPRRGSFCAARAGWRRWE